MKFRLELVYPFFIKCCQYTDDIFWQFIFEDLAYGKSPYGTYITKNFLCCNYKNKEFSYKINSKKDPQIIYEDIYNLLKNKFGLLSEKDKKSKRDLFNNTNQDASKKITINWKNIKKKNIKNIIIENYVIEKKKQHNLSYYKSIYLLSIIIIGLIFKNITTNNIEFNNGEITNINNIYVSNKKINIQNMSYNTTKLKPQIIIEKKKNMYNIWNKFINTL